MNWQAVYEKKDGSEDIVDFDAIYLVQIIDERPKIFGYITGDEQKLLRREGLDQDRNLLS